MSATWNEAGQAELPPLDWRERGRLLFRAPVALVLLVVFFTVFQFAKLGDWVMTKLAGRPLTRMGPRIVQLWAWTALWNLGLKFVRHGQPMRRHGAFVANHSSWIDIVALQRAAAPFLVSKSEVRDWQGIGLIGRSIGTLFIDRKAVAAKKQEMELRDRMVAGDQMALFPEGTSTDGQQVIGFKSSLFAVFFSGDAEGGLWAQPVSIRYHAPEGLPPNLYGWWGSMGFTEHIVSIMARSSAGIVELDFLEPLGPGDFAGRKDMAVAAERAVRERFVARGATSG